MKRIPDLMHIQLSPQEYDIYPTFLESTVAPSEEQLFRDSNGQGGDVQVELFRVKLVDDLGLSKVKVDEVSTRSALSTSKSRLILERDV